ncbi:hypothetical protein EGW08_015978, partial [Elysia chlorotica]
FLHRTCDPGDVHSAHSESVAGIALCLGVVFLPDGCSLLNFPAWSGTRSTASPGGGGWTTLSGDGDGADAIDRECQIHGMTPWTAQVMTTTLMMVTWVSGHQWHHI